LRTPRRRRTNISTGTASETTRQPALRRWAVGAAYVYLAGLLAWFGEHLLFGDQWWWLFAVNSLAPYLFALVPVALALSVAYRERRLLALGLAALAIWLGLYGHLYLPQFRRAQASQDGLTLRVLQTNLLGWNRQPDAVVAALRAADADVIALTELNLLHAAAIRDQLTEEYPYQLLNPKDGVDGSGLISRYPFQPTDDTLAGGWRSEPIIVVLDVDGAAITFIRFHTLSGLRQVRERQAAAQALADFAADHTGPLIAAGDLNATPLNEAHRVIVGVLNDAWDEQGFGLGHTFPGAQSPGSSRPQPFGISVPMWLVRLDYIFYSDDFQATSAEIGPWDGVSDHRPVVADLVLQ
jgi:endonuclease/exonuclease/phosphatase (EEP) superfamily protein YafD